MSARWLATIGLSLNTIGAVLLIFLPLGKLTVDASGTFISYVWHDNVGAYLALVILAAGFPLQIGAIWRDQ
jgi:hypothetical protein